MGNSAISKRVSDVPKESTACAGYHGLWKIYPGVRKDTGEEVSVWAFDKDPKKDKAQQEQIFEIMKKDMRGMKECECGGVLRVIEVLEETKTTLAFMSERVSGSVAEYFKGGGEEISPLEISRGLYNLSEGLQVVHTVHRRLHLNLCPDSVVFTHPGNNLKLCGFGFSLGFQVGEHLRLASPYFLSSGGCGGPSPDLRYCGPETTLGGINPTQVRYLNPSSDVFGLGVLIFELYRFSGRAGPHQPHLPIVPLSPLSPNAVEQHHTALEAIGGLDMDFLPPGLAPLLVSPMHSPRLPPPSPSPSPPLPPSLSFSISHSLKLLPPLCEQIGMLQPQPGSRVGTTDICSSAFFATGSLAVLRAVDTLHTRDVGTQSSQLVALASQLSAFPPRLLLSTVIPAACRLCVANPALWVYALPLHVHLASAGRVSLVDYRAAAGKAVSLGLRVTQPVETMQVGSLSSSSRSQSPPLTVTETVSVVISDIIRDLSSRILSEMGT